eukprot:TRINITY_DN7215_c0_g1_i1.p1 TRINITY_DN7215_c0_g1~~TRINITY_DN7215_c0_g1_i1.p1  ORF type:complete len:331 (+),score=86.72 TRINITY_DN7215_c0_g1_i1:58-1050(+)
MATHEEPVLVAHSGVFQDQGSRPTMEDAHTVLDHAIKTDKDVIAFYGIYDGHAGSEAAHFSAKELHHLIFGAQNWKEDIKGALSNGFQQLDQKFLEEAKKKGWDSGATAVVAVLINDNLYVGNVGDSEACLVRVDGDEVSALCLTEAHKATNSEEKHRVENMGGQILFGRLFGSLAITRAFGDPKYKKPHLEKDFVSCEPALFHVPLNPATDKLLVLACDGLWDVMTHKDTAAFAYKQLTQGKNPTEIAKALVEESLNRESQDNVSVVVVHLKWSDDAISKAKLRLEEQKEREEAKADAPSLPPLPPEENEQEESQPKPRLPPLPPDQDD